MERSRLIIHPAPPFHFGFTAYSHGWVVLAPNAWDDEHKAVCRVQHLGSGQVVRLYVTGSMSVDEPCIAIEVDHIQPFTKVDRAEILVAVRHMFRVDEDLGEFYALCIERGGRWAKLAGGLGRLLRSPTLFEDMVKTICTTNIQWGGTKRMVREVVEAFGESFPGDPSLKAFPTPESIASVSEETFVDAVRLGYRGPFVYELAVHVASGDLDLDAFWDADISTADLKKRLLKIKGVGNYAAATLLMILGRYDELAVDTVFRQFVSKKYFDSGRPTDGEARAVYDVWDRWKYLAYWFDIWEGFEEKL
ncbi:MAG: DNA-3-methyladenine glycosylase 2 family protein [Anaerolineae bacterium]|nr:DNA-3-methyladenine glycosylase 2 family protein [Anaerolineae bacterium]